MVKVECIGCRKESEMEDGYDYSKYVCKGCIKIIENIGREHYALIRLIGDTEINIRQDDIIKKQELIIEFTNFLHSRGYNI